MSLIDQLRESSIPPSHAPVANEVLEIVGKLIAFVEHGAEFLEAAAKDVEARDAGEPATAVDELLSPTPEEEKAAVTAPATGPGAPAPAAAPDQADPRDQEIAELKQQVANLLAQQGRTTAEVTSDPQPVPGGVQVTAEPDAPGPGA